MLLRSALAAVLFLAPGFAGPCFGQDCDNDGTPDAVEIRFSVSSGQLAPIHAASPQTHTFTQLPQSSDAVTLRIAAMADIGSPAETIEVVFNGALVGTLFEAGAVDCPASSQDQLTIDRILFNSLVGLLGGNATITLNPSAAVNDLAQCAPTSYVDVTLEYTINDCDLDGLPDECEADCDADGLPDDCAIASGRSADCNANGVPDECETLADSDADGVPDDCDNCPNEANVEQADCDSDGVGDVCAISSGSSADCDGNGVPDGCDIAACDPADAACADCNTNGIPDGCEADCNGDGAPDDCDIAACDPNDPACQDCDGNGLPDACDLAACDPNDATCRDCNGNGIPDGCESDCNANGVPDACDVDPTDPDGDGTSSDDCNTNGVPDACDIAAGTSADCNGNGAPDECDITAGLATDCNENGVPDSCDRAAGTSQDCNGNEIPDECDITAGTAQDCDADGVPDECQPDCDADGLPDVCALANCDPNDALCADCNGNGVPDACDLTACDPNDPNCADCNGNNVPDGCEADCDADGVPDDCDIAACDPNDPTCQDCDGDGVPNGCDPDCNSNGTSDACDVTSATSSDCDADGVPDECQTGGTTDCNNNGTMDLCDIASGASLDANQNSVPDECEIDTAFFTDVDSDGLLGDPVNGTRTFDFAGGFDQGRIDWSGVLTIVHPASFGAEACLEITHPSGVRRSFALNPVGQTFVGGPTYTGEGGSIPQTATPAAKSFGLGVDPAGAWTFRFFETDDDGGNGALDAQWDSFTITLTGSIPSLPNPPTVAADFGVLDDPNVTTLALVAGQVKWVRFELADAVAALNATYLDVDTLGSTLLPDNDTELGLYDAWGDLIATNDDGGTAFLSLLSFGAGSGADRAGQDGDLFAGVYYLAVGGYNTTFNEANFQAVSTSSNAGSVRLNIAATPAVSPPPTQAGDVDGDCDVDVGDLAILLLNFGKSSGAIRNEGDLDEDGDVDVGDLAVLLLNFGAVCP